MIISLSDHIFQSQIKTQLPWSLLIFQLKTKIQLSYQLVVPHLLEPYFSVANCLSCLTLRLSLRRSRGQGCTSRATESAIRCRTATWRDVLLRHLLENKKRNNINRNIGNKRYMLTETMFLWCFVLDIVRCKPHSNVLIFLHLKPIGVSRFNCIQMTKYLNIRM